MISEYRNIAPEEIDTKASFTELGLDSLDIAELIIQIEDELGISIEVSHKINSVEKLAAYLEAKV